MRCCGWEPSTETSNRLPVAKSAPKSNRRGAASGSTGGMKGLKESHFLGAGGELYKGYKGLKEGYTDNARGQGVLPRVWRTLMILSRDVIIVYIVYGEFCRYNIHLRLCR